MHEHRKPLLSVLGLALLGVAMFVSVVRGPRDSFDQKTWLEANSMEAEIKCLRGRMVRHLREHVLRSGMGRDAVIALLGPADATRDGEMAYGLGYCSSPAEGSSSDPAFRPRRPAHPYIAGRHVTASSSAFSQRAASMAK